MMHGRYSRIYELNNETLLQSDLALIKKKEIELLLHVTVTFEEEGRMGGTGLEELHCFETWFLGKGQSLASSSSADFGEETLSSETLWKKYKKEGGIEFKELE